MEVWSDYLTHRVKSLLNDLSNTISMGKTERVFFAGHETVALLLRVCDDVHGLYDHHRLLQQPHRWLPQRASHRQRGHLYPSNFAANHFHSKSKTKGSTSKGNDQEVEFHEIKICFFMRSKLNLFMRLNFLALFMRSKFLIIDSISWSRQFSWGQNCLISNNIF